MQRRKSFFNNEMEQRFSLRKYTIGLCSVCLGFVTIGMGSQSVKADTVNNVEKSSVVRENKMQDADSATAKPNITPTETKENETGSVATTAPKTNTTSNGVKANNADSAISTETKPTKANSTLANSNIVSAQAKSELEVQPKVGATSIKVKENNLNNDKRDTKKLVIKPTNLHDESDSQTVSISYVDDDENGNLIWDPTTVATQANLKKLENYILVPNQNLPETITVGNKAIDPIVVHLKHKTEQRNVTKTFGQEAAFTLSGSYGATLNDSTGGYISTDQTLFIKGTQKYDLVTDRYIGEATWDYNHIYQGNGNDDDATEVKDLATINGLVDLNKAYIFAGGIYYAESQDRDSQDKDLQQQGKDLAKILDAHPDDPISTQAWLKDGLHADGYYLSEKTSYVYATSGRVMNLAEYQQKVDPNFTWTTTNDAVVMLGDHAVDHINPEKITPELLPELDTDRTNMRGIEARDGMDGGRVILFNYVPYRYTHHSAQRTINIHLPNGEVKTITQKADAKQPVFTVYPLSDARNKLASQETGKWISGEWAEYDAPVVAGYTATQPTVSAKTVTGDTQNETIDITYVASKHTSHVKLVDNDNKTIQDTPVMGKTGETANVSVTVPKGWQLVSGQELPTQISFNAEGHPDVVVQIEHKTIKVTPDNPKENGIVLPDNPSLHFNGVSHDDLNKTVTREVTITDPTGKKSTTTQTVTFTRGATVDEVTNKVTYDDWSENGKHTFDKVDVPTVPGYKASQNEVPATEVTSDMTDQTIDISYTANSQTIHINYVDDEKADKIVYTTAVTGKTGETVSLNLTVPDKYQLADGQQLPTTYTFAAYNGDVTIDLTHKVVQREATADVQIGLITLVDVGDEIDGPSFVVTQTHWTQLDDKFKDSKDFNSDKVFPSAKVGTLTGHVNYDLVDNNVVSFTDDWTSLNVGGQTYQMPDGTEVVNGVLTDSWDAWGKSLKEQFLKYYPDADPDYVNRAWHGYLSANKTNEIVASDFISDYLQNGLAGNESNTLAKAIGDQAVTAVKTVNKTIDSNWLNHNYNRFEFGERDGQLRIDALVPLVGVYIPYVEKTATRTINVTTPDGKTATVKQTATLAKQVDFGKDAHPDWTTSEWTSYDVPVIPGYTASQSNVAKEAVTGTTKDQTVNITYTANDGTQTIVYQDEDGSKIGKQVVSGKTDETIKVTPDVPDGYVLKGEVPSEVTIKPDDTPITVTVEHGESHVTPDKPVNKGDLIPNTKDKHYPEGLTHDDLNKTVTREVTITDPTGKKSTTTQTVTFTRGATVDEVTNKVTYDDWSENGKHTFDQVDVPTVPGYTASGEVPSIVVTPETQSSKVDITYSANAQTATITYIDDTEKKTLGSDKQNGKFNQVITFEHDPAEDIKGLEEKGYKLVSNDFNSNKYQADNSNNVFYVHLKHGTSESSRKDDVNMTVHYVMDDGSKAPSDSKQTVSFTESGIKDNVTGNITWMPVASQTLKDVDSPMLTGYTADIKTANGKIVNFGDPDINVTVHYSANAQTATITYIDDTEKKTLGSDKQNGKFNQVITFEHDPAEVIKGLEEKGYKLVSNDFNSNKYQAENSNNVFYVHLKHGTTTVTPDNPGHPGEPVDPKNPEGPKYPNGTELDQVKRTGTQTIHYVGAGDQGTTSTPEPVPEPTPSPDDQPDTTLPSDNNTNKDVEKDKQDKPEEVKKARKIIKTRITKQEHIGNAEKAEHLTEQKHNDQTVVSPVKNEANEPQLPQTGEANTSVIGLLGMLVAGFAEILGFESSRSRKHKN